MAFPPLMIATSAAAMGMDVHLFFTFWGMDIITKKKVDKLKLAPIGNPSLPMPNILGIIPGMTAMATRMIKGKMKDNNMSSIQDMIKMARDGGVKFHACTPTMKLNGVTREDLIPEVADEIGAATMLDIAKDANFTLFI